MSLFCALYFINGVAEYIIVVRNFPSALLKCLLAQRSKVIVILEPLYDPLFLSGTESKFTLGHPEISQ